MILILLKDKGSKYKSRIITGKTSTAPIANRSSTVELIGGNGKSTPKR